MIDIPLTGNRIGPYWFLGLVEGMCNAVKGRLTITVLLLAAMAFATIG